MELIPGEDDELAIVMDGTDKERFWRSGVCDELVNLQGQIVYVEVLRSAAGNMEEAEASVEINAGQRFVTVRMTDELLNFPYYVLGDNLSPASDENIAGETAERQTPDPLGQVGALVVHDTTTWKLMQGLSSERKSLDDLGDAYIIELNRRINLVGEIAGLESILGKSTEEKGEERLREEFLAKAKEFGNIDEKMAEEIFNIIYRAGKSSPDSDLEKPGEEDSGPMELIEADRLELEAILIEDITELEATQDRFLFLLNQRAKIVKKVGDYKGGLRMPVVDEKRRKRLEMWMVGTAELLGMPVEYAIDSFRAMHGGSVLQQKVQQQERHQEEDKDGSVTA